MEQLHRRLDSQNLKHFFVMEGGGPITIGYEAGIMDELRERGADFSDAHFLGTSAGSWSGGMVVTAKGRDEIMGKKQIKLFERNDPEQMLRYAKDIFGDQHSDRLNITATHMPSLRAKVLNCGEDGISIADGVTRSSSVPFIFPMAKGQDARGERWVDGAVGGVSAWLCALGAACRDARLRIRAVYAYEAAGTRTDETRGGLDTREKTRSELHRWKQRNPESNVILIRPNWEIGKEITAKTLFDFRKSEEVYWMAREQMAELIDGSSSRPPRESIGRLATELCRKPAA